MQYGAMLKLGGIALVGFCIGWMVNGWRLEADLASQAEDYQKALTQIQVEYSTALADALDKKTKAEQRVSDLDARYSQELNDAKAENNRLRDAVADGERRLRIKAVCPAKTNSPSNHDSASGVDDDGTVELDRATGRAVLSIREGMIEDRKKILALQEYIRDVCLK